MTQRVLTQSMLSFLLGILSSRYGNPKEYGIITGSLLWIGIGVGWLLFVGISSSKRVGKRTAIPRVFLYLILGMLGYLQCQRQQTTILSVEEYLADRTEIVVTGTIYKKEEKNENIIYYLKDSKIITVTDYISCNRILIYLNADQYSMGDIIQVEGSCESFQTAYNEGNFDAKSYYYSKNILFRVRADTVFLMRRQAILWKEKLYQLRKHIQQVYEQYLPKKEAGVLAVMTLGEKDLLDSEMKKLYQQSGISHVLAISGLHISILGMSLYRFLRKFGISYLGAGVAAGILALVFGQISGMELSTVRAVTMFITMLLGNILGMNYDSVTALSLSAFIQLWDNPYCLWNTGFLFSYSAVLAVVVVAKILQGDRAKIVNKNKIISTIFMSSIIQLVTLPLTVYFYYEFPLYSVCINGLLLPFMGIILVSGILGGVTGVPILLLPAYALLRWNEWICNVFQKLPGAVWITGKPSLAMLLAYYVILIVGLSMIHQMVQNKKIQQQKKKWYGIEKRIIMLVIFAGLTLFVTTARSKSQFQVCFLDVGQGDGIYIQSEEGSVFFLDGGSTSENKVGEYRILNFLKCRGVGHVDGWFVSHADTDHISGLLEVWESGYKIKHLFLSEYIVKDEAWQELCTMAKIYRTDMVYLQPGDVVDVGKMKLICLYPWKAGTDKNQTSLVLQLEYPGLTGLFAGDISSEEEQELLKNYPHLDVDLYKAAHHGSDGSSSREFMEQISPVLTVISCGENNNYGHPGKEAVERIMEAGSQIYYTMKGGQITVGCDEKGIWVREYR